MGFFGVAEAFGWSTGPFIGGVLIDAYGNTAPQLLWGVVAGIAVVAAIGFQAVGRHNEPAA